MLEKLKEFGERNYTQVVYELEVLLPHLLCCY